MDTTEEKVDRLLHDAEHADSGIVIARAFGDFDAVRSMEAKRDRLITEALTLDRSMTAEAWMECEPEIAGRAERIRAERSAAQ